MTSMSLAGMVDLALGSPEIGAVNFTMLHKLLHAMLQKLSISDVKEDIDDSDKDFLATIIADTQSSKTKRQPQSQRRSSHYHELESKVEKIQQQLIDLNALPSNRELFERAKGEQPRPVADMWQALQLGKKVETNEAGVSKLMSLVGDLMKEMQQLKEENEKLKKDTQDLKASGDDMLKKLQNMTDLYNMMNSQFSDLPNPDLFNSFVTWPGLEDALKGIRQELTDQAVPKTPTGEAKQIMPSPRPISAASTGKPESRPASGHMSARGSIASSRTSTPGPSNELQELLEKLGRLNTEHAKLEGRVTTLETKMKNKVDRDRLDELGLGGHSEDLEKRIKGLEEQMSSMKRLREKSPSPHPTLIQTPRSEGTISTPTKSTQSVPSLLKTRTPTPLRTPTPPSEPPVTEVAVHSEALETSPVCVGVNVEMLLHDLNESQNQQDKLKEAIQKCRKDIDSLLKKDPIIQHTLDKLSRMMKELEARAAVSADGDKVVNNRLNYIDKMLENLRDMILNMNEPEEEMTMEATTIPTGDTDTDVMADFKKKIMQNSAEIKNLQNRFRVMNKETNKQLHEVKDQFVKLSGDLESMQNELQQILNRSTKPQDSDALSRMQQAILQLQAELDRLSVSTQQLIDDNNSKQKDIDSLYKLCMKLEENKADKLFVQKEVDVKADKCNLDAKVNKTMFDTTLEDLNKLISDILGKLSGHEEEWRKALGQLSNDIDGKLDRLEFTPIRDELERQLKMLSRKLKALDMGQYSDDDAAGIRKQLIQRFHCISCDRQVDMMPQPPMASIPNPAGMPGTRSARPYTVFELDQIRQQMRNYQYRSPSPRRGFNSKGMSNYERAIFARQLARLRMQDFKAFVVHFGKDMQAMSRGLMAFNQNQNQNQNQLDMADVYATSRSCGGSHTTTFPHRRVTRVCNQGWKEEEVAMPVQLHKPEMGIQGADGHIYRGQSRPGAQSTSPPPKSARVAPSRGSGQSRQRPSSAQVSRPSSARVTSRPQSAVSRDVRPTAQSTDAAVLDHTSNASDYDQSDPKIDALFKPLDNFTEA